MSKKLNENENKVNDNGVIDNPQKLDEETIKKVKDQIADEVREQAGISEQESDLFRKLCEEASMPVEFKDEDFKLGNNELDIRELNDANFKQMIFRALVLQNVYQKNTVNCLLDITKLLFILLDKNGVENIVKATDDILEKMAEQNEQVRKLYEERNRKLN